jgi:hypothetical protein
MLRVFNRSLHLRLVIGAWERLLLTNEITVLAMDSKEKLCMSVED